MKNKKKVRAKLIHTFLLVLLLILTGEAIVSLLCDKIILPIINQYLPWKLFLVGSAIKGIGGILIMLFLIVLEGIGGILPTGTNVAMWRQINSWWEESIHMTQQMKGYSYIQILGVCLLCTLILLILLAMYIIPYVVGALFYCRRISTEMQIMMQEDEKKWRQYDEQKKQMLSDLTHDLKTPITTIMGYSKALQEHIVPEDKEDTYLQAIYAKSQRMDDLITLLSEYVQLDSSDYKLQMESIDLPELLRENVVLLYGEFEKKEMEITIDLPEKEEYFNLDKIQFSRAITKLLQNAIEHNAEGTKILLRMYTVPEKKEVIIEVADTGEKIPDELARHIFEPFVISDEARRTDKGNGLGLSIVSKILIRHGFEIRLYQQKKGEYNKTFSIIMPLP